MDELMFWKLKSYVRTAPAYISLDFRAGLVVNTAVKSYKFKNRQIFPITGLYYFCMIHVAYSRSLWNNFYIICL